MWKSLLLVVLCVSASAFIMRKPHIKGEEEVQAIDWPFTTCGDGDWDIEKLTLGSTPKRNTNDDIDVTGTANDSICFNKVVLDVKLNGAQLDTQNIDYSDCYDSGDTVEFKFKNYIPGFAPPGTYTLSFQFIDTNGSNNGCLQFSFKL